METKPTQEVKETVWLWTVIGLIAGGLIGSLLGIIGCIIGGAIVCFLAYRSSFRNGGNAPAWLWRSKSNKSGFEVNELTKAKVSQEKLLTTLEDNFKKVSYGIKRTDQIIDVETIKIWPYVSNIISNNAISLNVKNVDDEWIIVADIQHKAAWCLWCFLLITFIFFTIFAIPVCLLLFAWFLLEERSLRIVVTECLQRVKKELEQLDQTP